MPSLTRLKLILEITYIERHSLNRVKNVLDLEVPFLYVQSFILHACFTMQSNAGIFIPSVATDEFHSCTALLPH